MSRHYFSDLESKYWDRLEILIFDGNKDKTHGKGYGEMEIISYALTHSKYILQKRPCRIMKITGRLVVRNVNTIIAQMRWHVFPNRSVVCTMNKELSFADSRVFIATDIFLRALTMQKNQIDDLYGVYFEHLLYQQIYHQHELSFFPFLAEPEIEGVSGSTGMAYVPQKRSLLFKIKYIDYQLGLQKCFAKQGGGRPLCVWRSAACSLIRVLCKGLRVLIS